MGRYWDHKGPQQAAYDRLVGELVPGSGPAGTLQGELLRAAGNLGYEFYNNGGGNNVSGALVFLKEHHPGFEASWWDTLAPYVTGSAGRAGHDVLEACDQIVDATVTAVLAADGRYAESPCDMLSLRVKETGLEPEADFDEDEHAFA